MMILKKIEEVLLKNKKYFIIIFSFSVLMFLGVISKSFFFLKEYFWYLFALFIFMFFWFLYYIKKNRNFGKFFEEALEEDRIFWEKIKEKDDHFYINKIIRIISISIIIFLMIYLVYVEYINNLIF